MEAQEESSNHYVIFCSQTDSAQIDSACNWRGDAGRIVVAGGMAGEEHVESMQRLDTAADKWVHLELPPGVAAKRSFLTACVV